MPTTAVSSVSDSYGFLIKTSISPNSPTQVYHVLGSTVASYVNAKTQTGPISNDAISTAVGSKVLTCKGGITASGGGDINNFSRVYNAVWNDYADFIPLKNFEGEPGRCYYLNDDGMIIPTDMYCARGTLGIHSDTFGYCPGGLNPESKTPLNKQGLILAVAGFVLAYVDKEYPPGTPLCSGKDGNLTKMKTRDRILHPERLVGTFFRTESRKKIYNGKVTVNGRSWVRVK